MVDSYTHSVSLDVEKCRGCTNCLKRCPTEAIRIRNGRAVINYEMCIDCGECVRVCQHKAKKGIFDQLADIPAEKKYRIALPSPSFYGQFENLSDVDYVLQGLLDCGFDDVFEVARAAELVSEYTRNYMQANSSKRPLISSACPAIVRLIRLQFPYLRDHVIPILPPVEIASRMAKEEAKRKHPELRDEDICTVFISPCAAKVSYVKNAIWELESSVDYVVSMSDIYFMLLPHMTRSTNPQCASQSGMIGIGWACSGGEASAIFDERYLAADGIDNAIQILDEIEAGRFPYLEFVELNACKGGCVGGCATVENPYIARVRLQALRRYLPISHNRIRIGQETKVPEDCLYGCTLPYRPARKLDDDMTQAMIKMQAIEELCNTLPATDCGSCGSPTCRAFAEDVVRGECTPHDCIVRMRSRMNEILKQQEETGK